MKTTTITEKCAHIKRNIRKWFFISGSNQNISLKHHSWNAQLSSTYEIIWYNHNHKLTSEHTFPNTYAIANEREINVFAMRKKKIVSRNRLCVLRQHRNLIVVIAWAWDENGNETVKLNFIIDICDVVKLKVKRRWFLKLSRLQILF